MFNSPKTLKEFTALPRFWRIDNPTEIVLSDDGIGRLFALIEERGKKNPFFVIDKALENQKPFARIFAQKNKFVFNASYAEVRTSDVDALVQVMRTEHPDCELIVGIGGGSTMDLAKATGICIANPLHAKDYQGYSMEMNRGTDVWVVPALNGTGAEITPIAVMRGPEKKLGINNILVEARGHRPAALGRRPLFQPLLHHDGLLLPSLRDLQEQDQQAGRHSRLPRRSSAFPRSAEPRPHRI